MIRDQVRRGAHAVVTTTVALTLGVTLAPAGHATTTEDPNQAPAPDTQADTQAAPASRTIGVRLKVATQAPRRVSTSRGWAQWLLIDEGIALDHNDFARVLRNGRRVKRQSQRHLRDGDTVHVMRVRTTTRSTRHRISRRTAVRKVAHLRPGQRRVVRPGHHGARRVTVHRRLHNGQVVRVKRSSNVVRKAATRRVNVGRRHRSVRGADRLNWTALARCESSNNPRAVNPAGYYGLYQFDRGTWGSVGGSGLPHRASRAEQTYRAKKLWKMRGRSPWPHCGRLL